MLKLLYKRKSIAIVVLAAVMMLSSCASRKDDKPPTAPVLTIKEVRSDLVSLAWSESYDDSGIDEYKLYRNGSVLASVEDTEYDDRDVAPGQQYEYYVVAYDKAGNKSSKSVRQTVKIDEGPIQAKATTEPTPEPSGPAGPSQPEGTKDLNRLAKSTVRLYALDDDFVCIGTGSGTIMNEQGYILTNYHCVGDEYGLYNSMGYVAIALTTDVRAVAQPQYFAQFRGGDPALDLAVVQITEDLNGNRVSAADLKLTPAKLGNSDDLNIGDEINILGYPGVGGDTITFTAGKVSGFVDENYDNEVDWIKTDAIFSHGNSGGTAINGKGEMIGVPTQKLLGEDVDIMFLLKPINQALSILEAAYAQSGLPDVPSRPEPYAPSGVTEGTIDLYGFIYDAFTFEPIEGAMFVILIPGVTLEQFVNNPQDSMIQCYAETDADGYFYCHDVPVGNSYSVLIGAEGYSPIGEDNAIYISTYETEDWYLGIIYLQQRY